MELLKDEGGTHSVSRLAPFASLVLVVGGTAVLSLKAGTPIAIPDSWLTFFGLTLGGYLGAKGINQTLGKATLAPGVEVEAEVGIEPVQADK